MVRSSLCYISLSIDELHITDFFFGWNAQIQETGHFEIFTTHCGLKGNVSRHYIFISDTGPDQDL